MKIEKSNYQGYVWRSNENAPHVYDGNKEFELEFVDGENPFVVEGFLCDGEKSISIKFADGRYIIKIYDLNALSQDKELYDERKSHFSDKKIWNCYFVTIGVPKKMIYAMAWRFCSLPKLFSWVSLKNRRKNYEFYSTISFCAAQRACFYTAFC